MARKDIFDEPFDDATKTKLKIYEEYLKVWLPTFLKTRYKKPIKIFDLFAGAGYDIERTEGSPILTLRTINLFRGPINNEKTRINLFLNELNNEYYQQLKVNVENYLDDYKLRGIVKVDYQNTKFHKCLHIHEDGLSGSYNLIFADQNGFKEITEEVFQKLITLGSTDFMFFISSSHIHRFAESEEFKKYHPKFDTELIKQTDRKRVHEVICKEYEKYIPKEIDSYALFPFSLLKNDNNNVYGLIFATKHPLGADKFLRVAWSLNNLNGTANYDIEKEFNKDQVDLFDGPLPSKIESFQMNLREKVLKEDIKNNVQAYLYCLNSGHISSHADDELKNMKKERLITFDSKSALVTYDQVVKKKRLVEYKVIVG